MNTVKKRFTAILCAVCICLVACARRPESLMPPTTTIPVETTLAPETTASPTTTAPSETHIELTVDFICQMLDEAGEYLDRNTTVTLPYTDYFRRLVSTNRINEAGVVSVSKEKNEICILDCKAAEWRNYFLFMICLNMMLERYPDCYYHQADNADSNIAMGNFYFFPEYEKFGYESMSDCVFDSAPDSEGQYLVIFDYLGASIIWKDTHTRVFILNRNKSDTAYSKYLQSKGEG